MNGLSAFSAGLGQKGKRHVRQGACSDSGGCATDAELMEFELQNSGMAFSSKRVETKAAYIEALSTFLPDVILSDYSLPAFDGITALQLRLERAPDTPFIFVTGALGEELAIDLLKQGATDYV